MAALPNTNPTLLDLANAQDPGGGIADLVDLLSKERAVVNTMTVRPGNLNTGHRSPVRTGQARGTWRKLYKFVQPSKITRAVVTDTTGLLEAWSEIDEAMFKIERDMGTFRLTEDLAIAEDLGQQMEEAVFYSNEKENEEEITGLTPRFNDLGAPNAVNILDAQGNSTDNGSIWLCGWSLRTGHGIVPENAPAGLEVTDLGFQTIQDNAGGRMRVAQTQFKWYMGLHIRDWRYFVRIANIKKSDLSVAYTAGAFSSGAHLPNIMYQAMQRPPSLQTARFMFYMSRDMLTVLQQQCAAAVQSSALQVEQVGGVPITTFHGIPIGITDALMADEARVVDNS